VKPVTLGPSYGERVAIQSGLSPGDRVVIDGADKLRNGAKVVPRDSEGGAPPAAPAAAAAASSATPANTAPSPDDVPAGGRRRRGGQ
jgi:multidrug efflux system membrane fusion protein